MNRRDDPKSVFRALIEGYDDLGRRLNRRLATSIDAQDVLQETWLKLARTAGLPDVLNPKAYVGQIAGNLAIDLIRAQKVRDRYFAPTEFHDMPAETPSAERIVDYRQRVARLEAIIAELPRRQREVFLLHKFDGLSHSQIAERLGISRSAVEKLVMKALASCRDGLGDLLDGD
jgi:RNA polymerase sigma factor (sigma-70 family)